MAPAADVKKHVMESLKSVPLGKTAKELQIGKDFYKHFFTNHPDLRVYFKGAENYTADDVQKSDRFEKLGRRILLGVHLLANCFDDETTFRAYVRDTMDRHVPLKIDPTLWGKFFCIFVSFLETRGAVSDDQKAAWKQLGDMFIEESQSHLRACGLPHA
ncbi:hypothetical protein Angca_007079 [Angiostrongylus cantonensis]|nr:hypothetical protein Angca_007079 [Angiostrongylus cantonensis]